MISIELEPPSTGRCECCGKRTTCLTRFVYKDGDAHAVYYARFSWDHMDEDSYVSILLSIGEWGNDAPPSERNAFYMRLRATSNQFETGVYDADQSPWRQVEIMGRTLNRDEALAHPLIKEVFHIVDHMVQDDTPLVAYLNREQDSKA